MLCNFSGFKDALSHENMGHTWDMEMFEQLVVHNYKAGIGPKVNETAILKLFKFMEWFRI